MMEQHSQLAIATHGHFSVIFILTVHFFLRCNDMVYAFFCSEKHNYNYINFSDEFRHHLYLSFHRAS